MIGQKFLKKIVGFLVETRTPKRHFEINWPLEYRKVCIPFYQWLCQGQIQDICTKYEGTFQTFVLQHSILRFYLNRRYSQSPSNFLPLTWCAPFFCKICSYKGGYISEDTGGLLNYQNKYSKSLSWAENLNKLFTDLGGKFKFSAQDSDLEYLFWQCKNPPVSSDLKPPLEFCYFDV